MELGRGRGHPLMQMQCPLLQGGTDHDDAKPTSSKQCNLLHRSSTVSEAQLSSLRYFFPPAHGTSEVLYSHKFQIYYSLMSFAIKQCMSSHLKIKLLQKSLECCSVKRFVCGLFFLENKSQNIGPLYLQIAGFFFIKRLIPKGKNNNNNV